MPMTKKTAKKIVKTASSVPTSPAATAVIGGRAAARWALDKYRAYAAAKKQKEMAARKAAAEKGADTYQPPTQEKPKKPTKPKKETYKKAGKNVKSAMEKRAEANRRALDY